MFKTRIGWKAGAIEIIKGSTTCGMIRCGTGQHGYVDASYDRGAGVLASRELLGFTCCSDAMNGKREGTS
jgi:hypothetical protein